MPLPSAVFEQLVEASPDILVATATDGSVAFYSDGARENLGYSRAEIIGRSVVQLYPDLEEAKKVTAAMRDPAQGGLGRVVNFPTRFVAKDGHEIPVAISGVILYDDDRKEQGTIGFAKDLREIMRKDQLAVMGEIAVGLSHEINNPLAVITNQMALLDRFLDQLSAPSERERQRARVKAVLREVKRIEEHLHRLNEMAEKQEYVSTDYLGDERMIDLSNPDRIQQGPLFGKRVLVVDDDAGVRESVAEILEAEGCEVEAAGNGREALALIESREFDLVLSDVVMPEMDGYDLYQTVRRIKPELPVALMTAFYYDKDHVIKRSRVEGLQSVLFKKPIDPDRLRELLGALVTQPAIRGEAAINGDGP